jgi:hypothetical protein
MTVEELPGGKASRRATDSQWITSILALGAGVALGVVIMSAFGAQAAEQRASTLQSPVAPASFSPRPAAATPAPGPIFPEAMDPSARQSVDVDSVAFSFSVPAEGWGRYDALYISKNVTGSQGAEAMVFWASFPEGMYARDCDRQGLEWSEGLAAAELAAALPGHLNGTEVVEGPTNVEVGGLAATRVVLFVRDANWCGPGFFYTWDGEDSRLGPLWGGNLLGDTITVWVIDAAGEPFIVASQTHLNAGAELETEVRQVIDSIEFAPEALLLPEISRARGLTPDARTQTTVDGVTFSFSAAAADWAWYDNLYLSKDAAGSQAAEAMVAWTRFPDGEYARACDRTGVPLAGATAADLAASLSRRVPGTYLVSGPRDVIVGGVAATQVELRVWELSACGRGYFFTWRGARGGPFWGPPAVGDTITAWVLDLGGRPFLIVAETHLAADAGLKAEVQQIVDSIQFQAGTVSAAG